MPCTGAPTPGVWAGTWAFMVGGWGQSSQAGIGKEKTGHCCQTCSRQDSWPCCRSLVTTFPSPLSSQLHGTVPVPPRGGGTCPLCPLGEVTCPLCVTLRCDLSSLCYRGVLTCPLCAILRGDLPTMPWLFFPARSL